MVRPSYVLGGRAMEIVHDSAGLQRYIRHAVTVSGTSPVLASGLLYVYDEIGATLRVLRPATGATVATLPAASGHWNSPIVVGGRVILPVGGGTEGPEHVTRGRVFIYHLAGR